ncbi:MAG: response regulator transcription factor [Nevskia sp.]|nr:response regulator transcription factor [Nevskia sp.]
MPRILTIEDDAETAQEIIAELRGRGCAVDWVTTAREGLIKAVGDSYDLITLDRMLPDRDGLAVVTTMREVGVHTPVLMISALSDVDERVRGLRAGGDDYLTKPFAPDEMSARVEVLLRRRSPAYHVTVLRVDDLELDLIARTARRGEITLELLPTEFKLLEVMMRHSGQVLTRMMLFETVWGFHFDPGTNVVNVHMSRLRKKVDPPGKTPLIRTVRGSGYILEAGAC